MSTCTSPSQRNYESPTLNMKGFKVGFTYSDFVIFQNNDRSEKDINTDTFAFVITNAAGTVVETLTLGAGLTIEGLGKLIWLIGTDTTGTAGIYTYELIWTQSDTGAVSPALVGRIIVEA